MLYRIVMNVVKILSIPYVGQIARILDRRTMSSTNRHRQRTMIDQA
jgi:hypothetical protein